ncbi:14966_t:CDS:1, partial [Cetraspora pellucida]
MKPCPRGKEFQRMIRNFLVCYKMIAVINEVPDGGVDIHGSYKNLNFAMQVKYHHDNKNNVGVGDIREFCDVYSKSDYENFFGIIVTNSGYTEPAVIH